MYEYPLTPEQLFFYDLQKKYPSYPICNGYAFLVKLHDWVDMKKMSESLVKTAQAHPACLSLVEETGGGYASAKIRSRLNHRCKNRKTFRI